MKPYPLVLAAIAFTSCSTTTYYQSPLHANANGYKAIPLLLDSTKSAMYTSAFVSAGAANKAWRDDVKSYNASIHRSHNFGRVQGYYGVTGGFGSYKVDSIYNGTLWFYNAAVDTGLINANTGRKQFGFVGGFAAADYVIPLDNGEWRVIGAEFSMMKEYGDYQRFRKMLPDTAANMIEKRKHYLTININSDLVLKTGNGSVGFKLSLISRPGHVKGYDTGRNPYEYSSAYLATCIHAEFNNITAFMQLNSGTYAATFLAGANYRFWRRKSL